MTETNTNVTNTNDTPSNIHTILNRTTHDAALAVAEGYPPRPILIYVHSASQPICKTTTTPRIHELARSNPHVSFYTMELTAETAPMIKFGVQNCPIFILMRGRYCETVLGPDLRRVERLITERFDAGKEEEGM